MSKLLLAIAFLGTLVSAADARPYYAASKGISCAACHVSPAGGGVRKANEKSPGRLTDNVAIGADLRAYFSQVEKSNISTFNVARSALYITATPRPDVTAVVDLDDGITSQVYGIWTAQSGLPFYVRVGRFWLPYGIQWDDPDNSVFSRNSSFAPNVGFDMTNANADTGVEVGLAPKRNYFANLALTNGQSSGNQDNNERKAVTGRAGIISGPFMLGGSFYTDKSGPAATDRKQTRFGPMAWLKLGPAALLYEGGFGADELNAGGKTKLDSHAAELDVSPLEGWLGKLRFDSIDPNTSNPGDDRQRYSLGIERIIESLSFEIAYRINKETPSVKNNSVFAQTHLWF